MKIKIAKLLFVSGISLMSLNGCIDQNTLSNPNTQIGSAAGALAGAVIGGNVGDRSSTNIVAGTVLGALAGGSLGNVSGDKQPKETGGWQ